MRTQLTPQLLQKYLSGSCTEEEKKIVLQHLDGNELSDVLDDAWNSADGSEIQMTPDEIDAQLQAIKNKAGLSKVRKITPVFYRMAAAVAIVATGSLLTLYNWTSIINYVDPVAMLEVKAGAGQRMQLFLPDGSEVWLNGNTIIKYPDEFRGKREVSLSGEAYFHVSRNEELPFIINSGKLYTRVLGTSFNVKAYQDDKNIEVTVESGKVEVGEVIEDADKTLSPFAQLTANHQFLYTPASGEHSLMTDASAESAIAWKAGRLIFRQTPITEAVKILKRRYPANIALLGDTTGMCTFTADFKKVTSLHDVLEILSMTNRIEYTIDGQSVEITVKDCNSVNVKP